MNGDDEPTIPLRYWKWRELQCFLLDHDLAIAEGLGLEDDLELTGRGEELFAVVAVIKGWMPA